MKQSKLLSALLSTSGVGAVLLTAGGLPTDAQAGISNTKHNLTLASNVNRVTGGAGTEVCVFCHTPHGADTSAPVPLWNKRVNTGATYTTYASMGSSSMDGQSVATGSVSLACLSCHDGTQAMDNIINSAGSLGLVADGGATNGQNYTWNGGARTDANGLLAAGATVATNIGADLRNDHPIGITYCSITAVPAAGPATTGCLDGDFKPYTTIGTGGATDAKYYVDTNASGTKDKSDMILYTRTFGAGSRPSVECATCHDPHVETKAATEVAFLRVSQANSGLCLSCHVK